MKNREHLRMIECVHAEADELGPICLSCGRVTFDPSHMIIGFALLLMLATTLRLFL
jgi:hypothetical protein